MILESIQNNQALFVVTLVLIIILIAWSSGRLPGCNGTTWLVQTVNDKATADKATADKATADKATADKATVDKVTADKEETNTQENYHNRCCGYCRCK